ncbi:arginine--tRNA ligase [Bacteroidota bacterium]
MDIESIIQEAVNEVVKKLYETKPDINLVQVQKTRKDFSGDFTIVVFPFLRFSKKSPEITANEIGEGLINEIEEITSFNVIKGFLNLEINYTYWNNFINSISSKNNFAFINPTAGSKVYMVEYSSPNTNKPLHLGHIRNNLLGYSVSRIIEANGNNVIKVNLVNDRGIHICKTMLAWQKWSNGDTPENTGKKGDKLVGDLYVKFELEYKKQIISLIESGKNKEQAEQQAPLILEARELLRKWEARDPDTIELWKKMNSWVYQGFDSTYKKLGVEFDKVYYESDTYSLGRDVVNEGVKNNHLIQKEDNSIWADLSENGLDQKLLLRSDGTSVYITQDLGTAIQRYEGYNFDKHIYVVGNEQEYHFQVLSLVLQRLGYNWGKNLYHLSYGMVELPEGKMKSREGKVVDADDLIEEMINTAKEMSEELGKLEKFSEEEKNEVNRIIALGALKYFILKVDPRKNMLFNPAESIDFNGNTGPFIQYTCVRISSILKKANDNNINIPDSIKEGLIPNKKEIDLIKMLYDFPNVLKEAGENQSPALIANYSYELAKEYNQYYHDNSILKEKDNNIRDFRILLSNNIGRTIRSAISLLGIEVPERM